MSFRTRRLYLNSTDNINVIDGFDGNVSFDLTRANINCRDDQILAVSLVRAELPSTCGIQSTDPSTSPTQNNLILTATFTPTGGAADSKTIYFNPTQNNAVIAGSPNFRLTFQNTINDLIGFINSAFGADCIKIDDATESLGLFRLIGVGGNLVFDFAKTSPELLRALGLNLLSDTGLSPLIPTFRPFDLSQVLPVIRVKANYNFSSESSNTNGDSSILDSIAGITTMGNQYFNLRSAVFDNGDVVNIKNKSAVIHENSYMTKQIIHTKKMDDLNIRLVSKDDKPITVNNQPFLLVIQIDTLDSVSS